MYFGIDTKGKYDLSFAIRQASKVEYLVIDEVSMMPYSIYELLYRIKLITNVKFILVGDYKQLPAVESKKYNYSNSLLLKELVDFNIEVLTVNHRNNGFKKGYHFFCKFSVIKERKRLLPRASHPDRSPSERYQG